MFKNALSIVLVVLAAIMGLLFLVGDTCACVSKAMAYVMNMQSDLRNLVTAEEAGFARDSTYHVRLDSLNYVVSTGVTVTVLAASRDAWYAKATHANSPATCAVYVGPRPTEKIVAWRGEGEVVCRDVPPRRFAWLRHLRPTP